MNRCNEFLCPGMRKEFTALDGDPEVAAHQRLRRRRAQADNQFGLDGIEFRFEPRTAGRDFNSAWFRVNAPLAAFNKLEVLYCVGNVNLLSIETCFMHGLTQQPPRWAHEWMAFLVFLIARLFADHDNF